jgi:beta-fructofuranosidase
MNRALRCLGLLLLALPLGARGETDQEAIVRATAAMNAATNRAQADLWRPTFHVTAPAQWVNDPNGPIYHKGFYHLFYQLTPDKDESGIKYWGHVRSRDLAKWEHLPIALAPSGDKGEESIWSGCAVINGLGQPMAFYTSIGKGKSPFTEAVQWAATGDQELIRWEKIPLNPVLTESVHDGQKIYDWRDPFIFQDQQRTFMVLGGSLNESKGGQAVVTIYEAESAALTRWKYRGVLFQLPDAGARTAECPNFFKLGDEWVLFVSPYGKVQYYVGAFDAQTCRFVPRARGLLDHGPNFYAPNTVLVPDGRRLVWGWVNGFPNGRGWNGCLSLPRELSLTRDGQLRQTPTPQLRKLRGEGVSWQNLPIDGRRSVFELPKTNSFAMELELELQMARGIHFAMQGTNQVAPVTLDYDGLELALAEARAPLQLPKGARTLKLQIFMDRSVLEVFADEQVCLTKRIEPLEGAVTMEIRADNGTARLKRFQTWPMKTIW